MDFVYNLYDSLMWIKVNTGEQIEEKPYMTLTEIDDMDIFFYLDLRIYQLKQQSKENTKNYDKMGL
ncbi:hypothetical protein NL50_17405 [Clostridium acetobutylicum]|nr:hypothetical protein NL50_17405 [Clostridium acetobutylicum]